ncbi:MAG: hypothetical protein OEY94_03305 [Alphaproteobacteria bacterium]|nr:hypothetical protein [Alphaproteobacteria bacterium]
MKINVSLLREKFVIEEEQPDDTEKVLKIIAPSNRLPLHLQSGDDNAEEFVVRANTMQLCIRFASQIVKEYEQSGPLFHRVDGDDWLVLWDESLSDYERKYNDSRWVCVYYNGKPIYSHGDRHPFFDVIEKCDVVNKGKYEDSIDMAKQAFGAAGKNVRIDYDSNVALVSELNQKGGRCGMILRSPKHTVTFNFYIKVDKGSGYYHLRNAQILSAAAAFIEGTQLCFTIGTNKAKLKFDLIRQYSPEYQEMKEGLRQIQRIESEISVMENRYEIRYRPEKPIFRNMIQESEDSMEKYLRSG